MGQWLIDTAHIVIENRPGAASNIAAEAVVKAPPDGYTLLHVSTTNAINATLYDKLNFRRDIAPVAGIIRVPLVMVINPLVPAKTVYEFIAYAKANPGRIRVGVGGQREHRACNRRAVQDDDQCRDGSRPLPEVQLLQSLIYLAVRFK